MTKTSVKRVKTPARSGRTLAAADELWTHIRLLIEIATELTLNPEGAKRDKRVVHLLSLTSGVISELNHHAEKKGFSHFAVPGGGAVLIERLGALIRETYEDNDKNVRRNRLLKKLCEVNFLPFERVLDRIDNPAPRGINLLTKNDYKAFAGWVLNHPLLLDMCREAAASRLREYQEQQKNWQTTPRKIAKEVLLRVLKIPSHEAMRVWSLLIELKYDFRNASAGYQAWQEVEESKAMILASMASRTIRSKSKTRPKTKNP